MCVCTPLPVILVFRRASRRVRSFAFRYTPFALPITMLHNRTGAIIYLIIEVLVLALTAIGTPIEQFVSKSGRSDGCITMWGVPSSCGSSNYNAPHGAKGVAAFGCGQRKNNMTGAAAFAIISIVVVVILVLYGLLMFLGMCKSLVLPAILTLLAVATLLVCWACVAGVYNNSMCNCYGCGRPGKYKDFWLKYGAGFWLIVVAWIVQVIGCVFTFVMMFLK